MRKKYTPQRESCLIRLEHLIKSKEADGDAFEYVNGIGKVFTVGELSYILKVSPTTIGNLVSAGRLKCLNLRNAVRFRESDLLDFIGTNDHATV